VGERRLVVGERSLVVLHQASCRAVMTA